ncbi:hypothetical protein U6A24_22780 [Aquimarina gracilis]|uniref:Lipoprotein n=1 Tax=Aquimarina gracilis TaxID=874422 RepID=A0ABU6A2N8_9FLAO|nr:hypothetical protein [Aquimarina gracilis]MEB3348320.1 hypothetical protein [Aquimarina gracilis]
MAFKPHINRSFCYLRRSISYCLLCIFLLGCTSDDTKDDNGTPNPNLENIDFTNATTATDDNGNSYEIGFNQVTSINQDPFVRKKNAAGETIWYVEHEKSEVDGRAKMILIDNNNTPWVVFTVVGGSNTPTYITTQAIVEGAFANVYQKSYGTGGGPKVSIIAKLNPETGAIEKATYMIAKKDDGKTNGFNIQEIGITNQNIAVKAESVAWPPGTGTSYQRFPDITDADRVDGVFNMYYEVKTDLTQIVDAQIFKN